MIDLFFAPTPNGWKVSIMLEELGVPYNIRPIRLGAGEQYAENFLRIAPNNRIPAIVDRDPDGGQAVALMESGAILMYLADKHRSFLPSEGPARWTTIQWLMWQVSGLGPMLGQNGHFLLYARETLPYALDRFRNEAGRLYGVLDRQLARTGQYVAGESYSIADIACFPWIMTHKKQQIDIAADFPNVQRWFTRIRSRPAVQRGIAAGRALFGPQQEMSEEARRRLFGLSPKPDGPQGASA